MMPIQATASHASHSLPAGSHGLQPADEHSHTGIADYAGTKCRSQAALVHAAFVTLQVIMWDLRGTVGVSAQLGSGSHASHPIVQVSSYAPRWRRPGT